MTKEEIKELENLDLTLLRKVMRVPFSTPIEAYYLELGILSFETTIKKRRVNFLHYLLSREEDEMLYSFFITQLYNPTPGDWTEQVKLDCKDLKIPFDFEYIRSKSKETFKKIVRTKADEYELDRLRERQVKHSKMSNVTYTEMKPQSYFKTPGITTEEALNIFRWRVRMAPIGENYRGNQERVMCPLCKKHLDNQPMALQCEKMNENQKIKLKIEDLYKENIPLEVAQELLSIINLRERLIKEIEE